MSNKEFAALLTLLVSQLVGLIESEKSISPQAAAELLYSSELFTKLEQEETKLWHLSAHALLDLLEEELSTGRITYPMEA